MIFTRKGQVTVFVIIGILIIFAIVILFLFKKPVRVEISYENKPQSFLESCTRDAVTEAINLTLFNGGDITVKDGLLFKGREITYLCYTSEFYKKCINQRPLLIEHVENEITNYIVPKISDCFRALNENYGGRYDINMEEMLLVQTKLSSKNVLVTINKNVKMSRDDKVIEFKNFNLNVINPIYDLLKVSNEIVNQESHFCNFDNLGFMIIYPKYDIDKISNPTGEPETIYRVKDRKTKEEFVFAVRSCPVPPGV